MTTRESAFVRDRAVSDQLWATLADRHSTLVRIALDGPQPEDHEFVQVVMHLVLGDLLMRAEEADHPTDDSQ